MPAVHASLSTMAEGAGIDIDHDHNKALLMSSKVLQIASWARGQAQAAPDLQVDMEMQHGWYSSELEIQ